MNNIKKFITTTYKKNDFRVLIYASLILLMTSLILQYPFHTAELNKMNDAESYKKASEWLYSPDHFASFARPFLFPLIIGLPMLLGFNYSEYFVAFINYIAWLSTVWLLFKAVKSISDEKQALKIALFFASCVSLHCFTVLVHTETVYTFVLLGHVFCLYQYLKLGKEKWFYAAVWLIGASVVIRPTLTYFVGILYFVLIVLVVLRKVSLKKLALISLIFLSTIGLQMLNMYRFTHNFRVSYLGDVGWYMFVGAYAISVKNYPNQSIDFYAKECQHEMSRRQEVEWLIGGSYTKEDAKKLPGIEKMIKTDMIEQLSENKKGLAFTFFRSLFVNSRSGTQFVFDTKNDFKLPYFEIIQLLFFKISQWQNILNSCFVLLILPITFLKRCLKGGKPFDKHLGLALYSWFIAFSIIVFSTVSFTQGDRFHVVTVPLTLFAVSLLKLMQSK